MWIITGRWKFEATSCARRSTSKSFEPATSRDNRALTPTITSRLRAIASRAAEASARLRSIVSPSGMTPARPMLIRVRHGCGAALAIAIVSPIWSAPCDPASIKPVTPSPKHSAAPSLTRSTWVWIVDQARYYPFAAGVDGFRGPGLDVVFDRRDPAERNRHITNRVEMTGRIDYAASLDDEVVFCRGCREYLRNRRKCRSACGADRSDPLQELPTLRARLSRNHVDVDR
jgi:hypothetical protein